MSDLGGPDLRAFRGLGWGRPPRRPPPWPRPGYRVTITQRLGDRPIFQVECLACPDFHEPLDHPALDVVDPELMGRAVLSGIVLWLTHKGERHP